VHVLVTGGAGFIGRYVCEELQARGHTALILDRHGRKDVDGEVYLGDVMDPIAVNEAMAHCDGWIHLAAVLGTQETIQNPRPAAQSNLIGGLNVLEGAAHYKLPGVYIGVGNHWMNNPYSITKTMIERFVEMYNEYRGTRVNIVRAMNAYGPRQLAAAPYGPGKVRKITPAFICRALAGHPVEVYGGDQVSDMVWVGDVARALVLALEAAGRGEVYPVIEVGPTEHTTVRDVAELVVELCDSASEIVTLPMRPGEIPHARVTANNATLRLIGLDPADLMPLREGMARTVEYFRGIYGR